MRIIAGELGGRRIRAPAGESTRPMLDRVREAVFSTLADWMEDARVLDLFAGSGALALEALSRGAHSARLVEKDEHALAPLRANVEALGLSDRAMVVRGDALAPQSWATADGARYDLVFLDPPYELVRDALSRPRVLAALAALAAEHLAPAGRIVLHVPRGALAQGEFSPGLRVELREYGTSAIWYVAAARAESPR